MGVIRNESNSVRWQLCDEKESKEKPHCVASGRGVPRSNFVAREVPGEPKLYPSRFPGEAVSIVLGMGPGLRVASIAILYRGGPTGSL